MPNAARPVQVYDFTAFSRRTPAQQQPGDRLDAQFAEHARAISDLSVSFAALEEKLRSSAAPAPREATLSSPSLYVNAGGFYASDDSGATATSADYAQVSIDWAEHMPDTIPGNTLAINAITGDHWSSRWWANKCANLVSNLLQGGAGIFAEQVAVTAPNVLAALTNAPVDAATTMQMIVDGKVYSGCVTPKPFTVAGNAVTWAGPAITSANQVVARYRYAVTPTAGARVLAISLYYVATQGQTIFPLSTPDRFALSYVLKTTSKVAVYRNGQRLNPDDGSGKGSYTVSQPSNQITLLWPAGVDETIAIDIGEPA